MRAPIALGTGNKGKSIAKPASHASFDSNHLAGKDTGRCLSSLPNGGLPILGLAVKLANAANRRDARQIRRIVGLLRIEALRLMMASATKATTKVA